MVARDRPQPRFFLLNIGVSWHCKKSRTIGADGRKKLKENREECVARNSAAKITRRSFGGMCMGAAAFGSAGLESISQAGGSQAVNNLTRATTVDQNPIRRRGTGLRGLDEGGPEAPSAR